MLAAGPELRITGAAAQTRMVSVARIRLVSRKSPRLFKGIICADICEFESYMPSQPVWSLCPMSGSQKYWRDFRELKGRRIGGEGRGEPSYAPRRRGPVS